MISLFRNKNNLLISTVVLLAMLNTKQSLAVTPENLEWYKNKITNTERDIEEQTREDIRKGIRHRSRYDNLTNQDILKNKVQKKIIKKSGVNDKCLDIKTIVFQGGSMIPSAVKDTIKDKYINKCLTAIDIEIIMSELVNWLISRGLSTTRVYLEAQDLNSGELKLRIQAGIVSDIILEDGGKNSVYLPTLFPFVKGNTFKLENIEQGVFQVNKQRSNNAKMEIRPGKSAGDSIIVVTNKRSFPLHYNFATDNHGSLSTGKVQAAATVTGDNLIGLNDILTFTHRQTIPDLNINSPGESMSDSIALVLPIGYFTYTLDYAKSNYQSNLTTPSGAALQSAGSTDSVNAAVERVMFRKADTITNSYLRLNYNRGKNYLNDVFLEVSSLDRTTMTIGTSVSTQVFGNPLSMSLDYSRGLSLFGAVKNIEDAPSTLPVNLFRKLSSNVSYTQPLSFLSDDISLTSTLSGQYALDNLPSSQRMIIGSKSSVRGYIDNSLSGDNGVSWKNEVLWNNPVSFHSGEIRTKLNAGYDIGWVKNRNDVGSGFDGKLSGGSVGLTVSWKNVSTSIAYDFPIQSPDYIPNESGQFWWRLSIDI